MTVERLGVELVKPAPMPVSEMKTETNQKQPPILKTSSEIKTPAMLAVFEAIAAILAIRLFLLLAIVGAFVLGLLTVQIEDNHSLWTLGIYCAFTILPLVFLDRKERVNE